MLGGVPDTHCHRITCAAKEKVVQKGNVEDRYGDCHNQNKRKTIRDQTWKQTQKELHNNGYQFECQQFV